MYCETWKPKDRAGPETAEFMENERASFPSKRECTKEAYADRQLVVKLILGVLHYLPAPKQLYIWGHPLCYGIGDELGNISNSRRVFNDNIWGICGIVSK